MTLYVRVRDVRMLLIALSVVMEIWVIVLVLRLGEAACGSLTEVILLRSGPNDCVIVCLHLEHCCKVFPEGHVDVRS